MRKEGLIHGLNDDLTRILFREVQAMTAEARPFERLRQVHAKLLRDLQGLDWMAEAATAGEELSHRLRAIRDDVANHFHLEEQDVYVNPVLKMEPAWERKAREMLAEHRGLLQGIDALIAAAAREGARKNTGLWARVKHWVDQMLQHEARENELFDQAGDEDPCCRRD